MANKFTTFITDVKIELKKVSWPTRGELMGSTAIVIIAVALLAIAIGVWDFVLSRIIDFLLR